ncbi:MAG: hypothetical protein M3O31_04750 [Acidobacteriota bacterium]|nr:hypothetical protein [Acidobacteriota bacterium]
MYDEKSKPEMGYLRTVKRLTSRARLYRTEPCCEVIGEWDDLGTVILESFQGVTDGKLYSCCVGGILGTSQIDIDLPHSRVECGSELIEILANFERKVGVELLSMDNSQDAIPAVPHLMHNVIGFIVKKGMASRYEGYRMSACSIDALPAFLKLGHPYRLPANYNCAL